MFIPSERMTLSPVWSQTSQHSQHNTVCATPAEVSATIYETRNGMRVAEAHIPTSSILGPESSHFRFPASLIGKSPACIGIESVCKEVFL